MFCWDFPIDTESIVEDADASISLWVIEVITLVLEDGFFRENCEAMAKSEGYVAENGFVATDPAHFGKTYHDKQSR